jgi:hypothetical protein
LHFLEVNKIKSLISVSLVVFNNARNKQFQFFPVGVGREFGVVQEGISLFTERHCRKTKS